VAPGVGNRILARLAQPGTPLSAAVRSRMEAELGRDLGGVRLHADAEAGGLASALSARAFTVGQHVFFGSGVYDRAAGRGWALLRHELVHAIQGRGAAAPAGGRLEIAAPDHPLEWEARAAASRRRIVPVISAAPALHVFRQELSSTSPPPVPASFQPPMASFQPPDAGAGTGQPATVEQSSMTSYLRSSDPEVGGRSVAEVGQDLRTRDERYLRFIPQLAEGTEGTRRQEVHWYEHLGLMGGFIDWFNPVDKTDPARWAAVFPIWDEATQGFKAALALPLSPDSINELGQRSSAAMDANRRASELDNAYRDDFRRYMEGYTHAAEGVHTVAVVVRDISFAVAVGIAVVLAAPVVAGALATFGGTTGTLGLSGGALTAFTYGGTTLAMGGLGAGIEGVGRYEAAITAENLRLLSDLITGSNQAVDSFNWDLVETETWDGVKKGFVDGVLAFVGVQAEKALVGPAAQALTKLLGPSGSSLMAMALRRALTRAISGGVVGGPIGALQAGYQAAAAGGDLGQIAAAMERGFAIGTGLGTVLGGVGGAFEGRAAFQVRQQVADRLRALVPTSRANLTLDAAMAQDTIVQQLIADLQANSATGTNAQLLKLLPDVYRALHDPEMIASVVADIWLAERTLGLMAPREMGARYTQAAVGLSKQTGAEVVTLPRGTGYQAPEFFAQVASQPKRFLDLSVLDVSPGHGATTHLIQDLVVDRALAQVGVPAQQFRALLGGAVGQSGPIGRWLWEEVLYDTLRGDITDPNVLGPALAEALPGIE
jgi:hypothetical protein